MINDRAVIDGARIHRSGCYFRILRAQGESLRQVARSYRVSYEAIRRILAAARKRHAHVEEEQLE